MRHLKIGMTVTFTQAMVDTRRQRLKRAFNTAEGKGSYSELLLYSMSDIDPPIGEVLEVHKDGWALVSFRNSYSSQRHLEYVSPQNCVPKRGVKK